MASILVIEDVPAVLLSMSIVLSGRDHQVTGVDNGTQGLELIAGAAFDLVITDLWLPGLSGAEVIRAGRAASPGTRFLAITGGDPHGRLPRSLLEQQDCDADAFLIKPFEREALLGTVSRLLHSPGSAVSAAEPGQGAE